MSTAHKLIFLSGGLKYQCRHYPHQSLRSTCIYYPHFKSEEIDTLWVNCIAQPYAQINKNTANVNILGNKLEKECDAVMPEFHWSLWLFDDKINVLPNLVKNFRLSNWLEYGKSSFPCPHMAQNLDKLKSWEAASKMGESICFRVSSGSISTRFPYSYRVGCQLYIPSPTNHDLSKLTTCTYNTCMALTTQNSRPLVK